MLKKVHKDEGPPNTFRNFKVSSTLAQDQAERQALEDEEQKNNNYDSDDDEKIEQHGKHNSASQKRGESQE